MMSQLCLVPTPRCSLLCLYMLSEVSLWTQEGLALVNFVTIDIQTDRGAYDINSTTQHPLQNLVRSSPSFLNVVLPEGATTA